MINLGGNRYVAAHMIVGIDIDKEDGADIIRVHTPDGTFYEVTADDLSVAKIDDALLVALASEIDKQCKEFGCAGFVTVNFKKEVERAVDRKLASEDDGGGFDDHVPRKPFDPFAKMDDEIPF